METIMSQPYHSTRLAEFQYAWLSIRFAAVVGEEDDDDDEVRKWPTVSRLADFLTSLIPLSMCHTVREIHLN